MIHRFSLTGALLLVMLLIAALGNIPVVDSSPPLPPAPLRSDTPNPPSGYGGDLDYLRPLYPIRQPPLDDPVGITVNASGTRLYIIEKGLNRLGWVDIAPASSTHGIITPVTGDLTDPQMAVALNAAETHAFVVENETGALKQVALVNGEIITVTAGLTYPIDLALSEDETMAYITQYGGALVAVTLGSGAVSTVTTALEYPGGIALSGDGAMAYVAEYRDGPLRQVNLATGVVADLGTGEMRACYDVAVDADGGYAYLGDKKYHLWRVDLVTGATEAFIQNTYERFEALALSPDGATLYGAQRGTGRLFSIDLTSQVANPVFPLLQGPSGVTLNPDGTRLYILEGESGELGRQDVDPTSASYGMLTTVAANVVPAGAQIAPIPISLAVDPTESWALVPYDQGLRRIDLLSGVVSTVVGSGLDGASGVALNTAASVAYVSHWSGISAIDTSTWTITAVPVAGGGPHLHAIALSADGTVLYGVRHYYDDYAAARLVGVRLADGQMTDVAADVKMPVGVALSADGEALLITDRSGSGRLLRVDPGTGETITLAHLGWEPNDVAVGPDRTTYITRINWLGDGFSQEGVVYGFQPGEPWRLRTLSELLLYEPRGQAISADGDWLYALANNSLFRIDLHEGASHGQITTLVDGVIWHCNGLDLTSDGAAWIVSDGHLHKVSLADGSLLSVVGYQDILNTGPQYGLGLSPDETLAYLGTVDGRLAQVNLGTGAVAVIVAGLNEPYGAKVNASGARVYLAEAGANRLVYVDVGTGAVQVVSTALDRPVDVALEAGGGTALVLENPFPDYHLTRVDLVTGAAERLYSGQYAWVNGIALTPDGSRAYFANNIYGDFWGVDLATGMVADSLVEALNRPHGFGLAEGGQIAYTTEEFVPRIRRVNLSTGQVTTTVHLSGPASGLVLSGTMAYVTRMYDDDLLAVDLTDGTWTNVAEGCMHGRIALSPDGATAYVTCPGGDSIGSVDLGTGARTELTAVLPAPYAMDINEAGTQLYTTAGAVGEPGDFQLWMVDAPTGTVTLIATLEEAHDAPGDLTLSPDERCVYVYDQKGSNVGAGVWRVDVDPASQTYGQVESMARRIGELQHGEFTDDGRLILSQADMHRMLSLCLGDDCIPLQADFHASPFQGLPPLSVSFTNDSRGDYTSSLWDFGDGITSTLECPVHIYTARDTYTVTLTVNGPGGTDVVRKPGYISVKCGVFLPLVLH